MKMNSITIALIILAVVLYAVCYFLAPLKAKAGFKTSLGMFTDPKIGLIPLILAAVFIGGLLQEAIPPEVIIKHFGKEAGLKGLFLGTFFGALMPGGPYVSFPIAGALFKSGASVGTTLAFISAWSLIALSRIPLEVPFLGKELIFVRILVSLMFPIIIGFVGERVFYLMF